MTISTEKEVNQALIIASLRADRAEIYKWMREPDLVEHASLEWLTEWINRRPLDKAHI